MLKHLSQNISSFFSGLHPARKRRIRSLALAAVIPVFGAVAAFGIAPMPDASDLPVHQVQQELAVPSFAAQLEALDEADNHFVHEERIRRGDTVGTLLTRLDVSDAAAEKFIRTDASARALYQLRPGRLIQARTDDDGSLLWLRYLHTPADGDARSDTDPTVDPGAAPSHSLIIERQGDNFRAYDDNAPNERRVELRSGEIRTSLFAATDAAGVPDGIATQIADIFSGDIDFYRDLRRGDRFRVVYEMYYQSGEVARPGRVLAVEFINGGRGHQAVWFQPTGQAGSYYGFDGTSMRRAFLRAPLAFTRISSGFGGRMHPILNTWRQHTGVDYAAPIGTPVRTTADGTVEFVGKQNGYGNAIQIQHQGVYSTLYGHLSAFASGLKRGQHVSQGQLIGYVGMTGWATGPHLHYEFRISGVARDPLRVALPQAVPVTRELLPTFRLRTADFGRQMDILRNIDQVRAGNDPTAAAVVGAVASAAGG